ncbi:MAG: GntR family transcriptional regulator [Candidatus Melainabacteria bacterium]
MVLSHTDSKRGSSKACKKPGTVQQGGRLAPTPSAAAQGEHSPSDHAPDYSTLENVSKADLTRIANNQLPKQIPDFQAPGATKDTLIATWLTEWITAGLASGKFSENHLLPRKADIAKHLGVSIGTVQNAIRYIEDDGHVESKQRIGTLLRVAENNVHRMRKQTSKRDQAVEAIKKFILDMRFQPGDMLPSAREVAKAIGSAPNTTRLALEYLSSTGTLNNLGNRGNKANWSLKEAPASTDGSVTAIESETLIDQLERDLKQLIAEQFEIGQKLPSHLDLSAQFKVSIKTVHDAMKRLSEQGIIRSKRGRYGTYVVRKPDTQFYPGMDDVFVPADEAVFYNYEKVERHLKLLIREQFRVGDKLPAMGELSKTLNVSSNTIRKALQNLAVEKLVSFSRGRYGGTYVTKLPKVAKGEASGMSWVSVNPETAKTYPSKATPTK